MKIKISTIARIGALVVALANQCLAVFGKGALPFTENMAYQVISLVCVVITAAITCWYNQDISTIALLCSKVFEAFEDGTITEEEVEKIISDVETAEKDGYKSESFIVKFANSVIANVKDNKKKG